VRTKHLIVLRNCLKLSEPHAWSVSCVFCRSRCYLWSSTAKASAMSSHIVGARRRHQPSSQWSWMTGDRALLSSKTSSCMTSTISQCWLATTLAMPRVLPGWLDTPARTVGVFQAFHFTHCLPYTGDTRSRNLDQSSCTWQKLARVSVNLVQVFLYKFLARNRIQLYSSTESVRHVTRTVQWLAGETVVNLSQIFRASFWYRFFSACVATTSLLSIESVSMFSQYF